MRNAVIIINLVFFVFLFGGYCMLILNYIKWFTRLKIFEFPGKISAVNSFSIIIPARNEEKNIENCINSVLENDYPKRLFEVIIVNDFSSDATAEKVKTLQQKYSNLRLINLADFVESKLNSYKKKAIEVAIGQSKNDWIITTDADCTATQKWLELFDAYIQKNNSVFIAAPVMFINNNSLLSIFQTLDFISLQGITAASVSAGFHSMCNGANLCYKKSVFFEANGFAEIDAVASGDDMLLMHKIQQKYPAKIGYVFNQNAVVSTLSMLDWKSFFNQRIRWASKATNYNDKKIFWVLLLVYFFNLYLFLLPFASIFMPFLFNYWLILLAAKTICELGFMLPAARFFNDQKILWWFPLMQPLHIIYTVIAGWVGKFGKYEWKGRIVK
ncbi:MAG: glycosyltransferase [Chitinophagaceae bacterium]